MIVESLVLISLMWELVVNRFRASISPVGAKREERITALLVFEAHLQSVVPDVAGTSGADAELRVVCLC